MNYDSRTAIWLFQLSDDSLREVLAHGITPGELKSLMLAITTFRDSITLSTNPTYNTAIFKNLSKPFVKLISD